MYVPIYTHTVLLGRVYTISSKKKKDEEDEEMNLFEVLRENLFIAVANQPQKP